MLCWIVYNKEDVEKNRRFIEFVSKGLEKYDIKTKLIVLQEIENIEELMEKDNPILVINRSRKSEIAYLLEKNGARVFNSARVTEISNDKKDTYEALKGVVPFMPFTDDVAAIEKFPYVIKSVDGHGGSEVFMVENESDRWKVTERLKHKKCIAQECASDLGKDVRVYVIGNQIVAAMLRTSAKSFKSNYSLGGNVECYQLNDNEMNMVKKILNKIPLDYGAVDFIFHNGQPVFNEIEDAAGARMLYENTDMDIVRMFVEYIVEAIGIKNKVM